MLVKSGYGYEWRRRKEKNAVRMCIQKHASAANKVTKTKKTNKKRING